MSLCCKMNSNMLVLLILLINVVTINGAATSRFVVTNRKRGDVVLFENDNTDSQISISLDPDSEPTYLSASILSNEFYVGDRANNKLFVYDSNTLQRVYIINACNGIFHQFYNSLNQLWVICDIDNVILIIDKTKRNIIQRIQIDNIDGFKAYDITSNSRYAFVSLLSTSLTRSDIGYIIQYSTSTLTEIKRTLIGGAPRLFINPSDPFLYVASQTSNLVYKLDINSLDKLARLPVPGAHGIWGTTDYLYVSNIQSEDGKESIYVIDLNSFQFISTHGGRYKFDAMAAKPYNVMLNCAGDKLVVTHGAVGMVSEYDVSLRNGELSNGRIIFEDAGSTPFGVIYLPQNGECGTAVVSAAAALSNTHNKVMWSEYKMNYPKWSLILLYCIIGMNCLVCCYCLNVRSKSHKYNQQEKFEQI